MLRLIKGGIIGLIGLAIVVTLISLLLPSEAHGRRGIVVNADQKKILDELSRNGDWKHWHPDFINDSASVVSSKDGNCRMTRNGKTYLYEKKTGAATDSSITIIQHTDGQADLEHILTVTKDQTTSGSYVDWKIITQLKWYPWEKFSGFFMESFAAPGMEKGLENLKRYMEGH